MGTNYKGTKREINALNSYIKLIRASDSLSYRLNSVFKQLGLSVSQYNILDVLYHIGPQYQKDLAKKLLKSGGNITLVVDNLEKLGYVRRERVDNDRRFFCIYLTTKGKNILEKIFPEFLDAIVNEFKVLTSYEQDELQRMCKVLGIKDNNL